MEILGIGPGEFIFILIILLVVVGPERLPGLARQAGQMLVRARNWLQKSPDAALVMRARQELEQELASLKTSLLEVQNVRDEVLGAAKQIEESVSELTSAKLDVGSLLKAPAASPNGQSIPHTDPSEQPSDATESPENQIAPPTFSEEPATLAPSDGASALPQPVVGPANGAEHLLPAGAALTSAEFEAMNLRLQAIMSDLWALQEQLKQRGALEGSWQPPSWNMQLPAPEAAALAEPAAPEETAAAPAGNHSPPAEPAAPPAKSRKRRARAAAATDTTEAAAADAPALTDTPPATAESSAAPKAKPRKRRAPASALEHSERSEETEPVATEEAT